MSEMMDVKKVYAETIEKLVRKNPDIMVAEADQTYISGTWDFKDRYPDRYVQVGIAEQNLIGISAGLASMGKTVYAFAFSNFLALRSADQISNAICYNELDVKIVGGYAGVTTAINGGTHISVNDVAIFRSLPNMTVIDPGDGVELGAALEIAAEHPSPVYIRVPKGPMPTIFTKGSQLVWGKGAVLRKGAGITLITTGITTWEGIQACDRLAEHGIDITHIHMPFIKPLDEELVMESAQNSKWLITVENHSTLSGLGGAVAEAMTKQPGKAGLVRLGLDDCYGEGIAMDELMRRHNMSADKIVDCIQGLQ